MSRSPSHGRQESRVTPRSWRWRGFDRPLWDQEKFRKQQDVTLDEFPNLDVEVKSRKFPFTSPADYPYKTAFFDTTEGWDAKEVKPIAVAIVSRPTGVILVASVRHKELWQRDPLASIAEREIRVKNYSVKREDLREFGDLVRHLHGVLEWMRGRNG